jgi:hypothetical protein
MILFLQFTEAGQVVAEVTESRWREADYWVCVATSDKGGGMFADDVRSEHCWCARSRNGELFDTATGSNTVTAGYHTAAILPAATEALGHIPAGSRVHVFSDVKFFTDILDEEPSVRVHSGYLRRDKQPLAYQPEWKHLDGVVAERSLCVSAGRPLKRGDPQSLEWRLAVEFEAVKEAAKRSARNIGRPFSDWDL